MHPLLKKIAQFAKFRAQVSLAQLVEQLTLNQWVESSSLSGDTKRHFQVSFFVPRPQTLERGLISLRSNDYCLLAIFEPLGGHKKRRKNASLLRFISSPQTVRLPQFGLSCPHPSFGSPSVGKRGRPPFRTSSGRGLSARISLLFPPPRRPSSRKSSD